VSCVSQYLTISVSCFTLSIAFLYNHSYLLILLSLTMVLPFRPDRIQARVRLLRGPEGLTTPAGGALTKAELMRWIDPAQATINRVIDVYLEQLCYHANSIRAPPRVAPTRAMVAMPRAFYTTIGPIGGEWAGRAMLRGLGISAAEFLQLEQFFIPMHMPRTHCSLVVVSPLNHTIEILDSVPRNRQVICDILQVIFRFLSLEMGPWPGNTWRILRCKMAAVLPAVTPLPNPGRNTPLQRTQTECCAWTCFFAKHLALHMPLDRNTDIGQGGSIAIPFMGIMAYRWANEMDMRLQIVQELFDSTRGTGWANTHPIGAFPAVNRHVLGGPLWSQQQDDFWSANASVGWLYDDNVTRIRCRTGIVDRQPTKPQLVDWCRANNGVITNRINGARNRRMQNYSMWNRLNTWSDFRFNIEEREWDIRLDNFP
jgi:hypothetical protein